MKKFIVLSVALILTLSLQAAVVNMNYSKLALGDLPYQPQPADLAQQAGSTKSIVAGGMHTTWTDNQFSYMFNSPSVGAYGTGSPDSEGGTGVLLWDAAEPITTSIVMHIDFTAPEAIQEVRIFSFAGDTRLFNYGEVSYSTSGSAPYTSIGAVSFGDWGDYYYDYALSNCLSRLYDDGTGVLASDVRSLEITMYGVMNNWTWANWQQKTENTGGGSVINELDIIGIPEPTLLLSGLLLGVAFLRRK